MTDKIAGGGLTGAVQRSMGLGGEASLDDRQDRDVNARVLALWVGIVAFSMPIAMLISGSLSCFRDSLSHYYYDGVVGSVFVGMLFFIGAFMFAYHTVRWVTWISSFAGACAFLVAVFPTEESGCQDGTFLGRPFVAIETAADGTIPATVAAAFRMFPKVSYVHFGAAAVLFLTLAFMCFVVFTRVLPKHVDDDGNLTPQKRNRNRLYRLCGTVIVLAIVAMVVKFWVFADGWAFWEVLNLTFWMEAIGLWAFGVSWVLKGRLGFLRNTALGDMLIDPDERHV